eukprot:m.706471 g.706471  ORF g.706471 m.706471 type:complete len:60 (-) comp22932_c0_seq7:113-292(-)
MHSAACTTQLRCAGVAKWVIQYYSLQWYHSISVVDGFTSVGLGAVDMQNMFSRYMQGLT